MLFLGGFLLFLRIRYFYEIYNEKCVCWRECVCAKIEKRLCNKNSREHTGGPQHKRSIPSTEKKVKEKFDVNFGI